MIGIYKITNIKNGKVYIGQSNNIERRWSEHKRPYKRQNPTNKLYQAFNLDGIENFNFEILEECALEELNNREKFYIQKFDSIKNGYNVSTIENLQKKLALDIVRKIQEDLIKTNIPSGKLAVKYGVSHTWISLVNQGKMWYDKNLSYPLRMVQKYDKCKKNYCLDCGKEIKYNSKRCILCANAQKIEIHEKISRDELKSLIRTISFVKIGKMFNVTDNTIRKWCDRYNLPRTKKEIKKYSNEEWKFI